MAVNEEIARLTGTLAFNTDLTGLTKFEAKLAGVEVKMKAFAAVATHKFQMSGDLTGLTTFAAKLADVQAKIKQFTALANQKHTIGVKLDAAGLKASIDKAANTKFRFNNVSVARDALDRVVASVVDRLARVPIYIKNVKIDMSAVIAQREALRKSLEHVSVAVNVVLKMKDATTKLRAWKKATEDKFKLYLNADISGAKLYRNAAKTLRDIGARLGTFKVKSPMIKLTVDRAALRAEIASVLEQIKREVKIKIDLNSRVSGNPHGGSRGGGGSAFAGGMVGGGMGFMRGLVPGLGAAYAVSKLNQINQQMQGQDLALTAVTGSHENGQAAKKRLRVMADDIGFNARDLTPAFTKMIASGEASGFGQAKSEKVFKSMAEYGRVMGLSSEDMKGSMRAVEQMMNKGQIMSEELKGQLGERFPAAIALFAKSQKMTIPELFKAMEKGLVKSDALEAFAETLAKEARKGGALEASKQGTAAQQQRMGNGISDSIASFSAGGFDTASARFFKTVAESLEKSQTFMKGLGTAFEILITPINAVIKLLGEFAAFMPKIAEWVGVSTGQLIAWGTAALIFLGPLGGIVVGLGLFALALEDIVAYNNGNRSLFGSFLEGNEEAQAAMDKLSKSTADFKQILAEASGASDILGKNIASVLFSDALVAVMGDLNTLLEAFNATVRRFVAAGRYAQFRGAAYGETGVIERNFNSMDALVNGPEWANEQVTKALNASGGTGGAIPGMQSSATVDDAYWTAMRAQGQNISSKLPTQVQQDITVALTVTGVEDPVALARMVTEQLNIKLGDMMRTTNAEQGTETE